MKKSYFILLTLLFPALSYAQTTNGPIPEPAGSVVFIGVGANSPSFNYEGSDALSNAKQTKSISPQINLGTDFYFDKYSQGFVLRLQLGYGQNKANLVTNYNPAYSNSVETSTETLKFNLGIASFTPQIIWNAYNSDNFKFYIDAGVAIDYCNYSNKAYTIYTTYSGSGVDYTQGRAFPDMRSIIFNLPLKVGFKLVHKIDIYADYIPKTALNTGIGEAYNYETYQFGFDYFFGKN